MCSLQRLVRPGRSSPHEVTPPSPLHKQVQLWRWQRSLISSKLRGSLRANFLLQGDWSIETWRQINGHLRTDVQSNRSSIEVFASTSYTEVVAALTRLSTAATTRIFKTLSENQIFIRCAPPIALTIFGVWGLLPFCRFVRRTIFQKDDRQWRESQLRNILSSYLRPLVLWTGVVLICRAFDPLVLATEASQAIKQRILNFVRSLSTVLAFAYCSSSLSQQLQKVMLDKHGAQDTRSVGAEFIGNTVYTAVWIAALCLFMELLGFSTQKWLTAGGLGTVLLTLAGREIFTNFLSSIMIHATRPFIVNEWIQTKIEGYEVSGTVEHVGWWSPTIVRGDDREAVHIPNHKFTVSVVRNLSQKSHWRIKTHFGISHLDASKIMSIVADMRKVLSKHPQVEQRRLHRRVFLESIDPENQALMVLVSCFVKTPHFEEYLRVKETILLDLLKVISHHHARLATPIRSVQRLVDDTDSRSSPFRDVSRSSETYGRPYLLIEASIVSNGHDTDEPSSVMTRNKDIGSSASNVSHAGVGTFVKNKERITTEEKQKSGTVDSETGLSQSMLQLEGLDSMGLNSNDITLLGAAFEKPPANIPEPGCLGNVSRNVTGEKITCKSKVEDPQSRSKVNTQADVEIGQNVDLPGKRQEVISKVSSDSYPVVVSEEGSATERSSDSRAERNLSMDSKRAQVHVTLTGSPSSSVHGKSSTVPLSSKQETDGMMLAGLSSTSKPQVEENLVLGVALDGPKRTLPLDDETPFSNEQKGLVRSHNGNPSTSIASSSDLRER